MKRFMIATTVLVLGAGSALAALSDIDADGDGVVSFVEMVAIYPTLTEDGFSVIDSNGDGVVDDAEFTAAEENGLIPEA